MMGDRPWNEELLDYLASYLVEHKYDMKALLTHICTSDAYAAQTSIQGKEPGGDDYVFRGPQVRRMTAEQFIDAIHQITHTVGGNKAAAHSSQRAVHGADAERRFVRASLQDVQTS